MRFLFDKYIIKREYKNEDVTGSWSLKELKVSGARSKKSHIIETRILANRMNGKQLTVRARLPTLCCNLACAFHILLQKLCTGLPNCSNG